MEKKICFYNTGEEIDCSNWREVVSATCGMVIHYQSNLEKFLRMGQKWSLDLNKGEIVFEDAVYKVQLIGNESTSHNTFLWGWENVYKLPDEVVEWGKKASELGKEWNSDPLKTAQFELNAAYNGLMSSVVFCGIAPEHTCFYKAPHEDGYVYVAIQGLPDEVFAPIRKTHDFINEAMSTMRRFNVNQLIFIEQFLIQNGTPYEWNKNDIIAEFEDQKLKIHLQETDGVWRVVSFAAI